MKTNPALARLRHHVTGAIERGEAEPVIEQPADDRAAWREEAAARPPLSGIGPGAGKAPADYLAERARKRRERCRHLAKLAESLGFDTLAQYREEPPRADIDGAVGPFKRP